GMSYSTLGYSDLKLSAPASDKSMTASVTVTNTGKVPGREVAQMYVSAPGQSMPKPAQELKGFAKTRLLAPGASGPDLHGIAARPGVVRCGIVFVEGRGG